MSIAIWVGVAKHAVGYPTTPVIEQPITSRSPLDQANEIISINQKTFFIVSTMFAVSLACSKASILFLYRRIFYFDGLLRNRAMFVISFMLVIVIMFGIGITFSLVFACGTHFSYWWFTAGAELKAHCIDTQMLVYAHSVSDFIIDAILIIIPIPAVWNLHLTTKRKLGAIAVFLTGAVAVVASLIKMIWFL